MTEIVRSPIWWCLACRTPGNLDASSTCFRSHRWAISFGECERWIAARKPKPAPMWPFDDDDDNRAHEAQGEGG